MASALGFVFFLVVAFNIEKHLAQDVPIWQLDGSPGLKSTGDKITCIGEGNVPKNGLWMDGVIEGSKYWEITFQEVSNMVNFGTTMQTRFGPGYETSGLFYNGNGNLSDGSGLLEDNFGPPIKSGDAVGMLITIENSTVDVYFAINGVSLGKAFTAGSNFLTGFLFPAVQFYGSGQATIIGRPPPTKVPVPY